jgi:preprotein translocase subunit Sec63
LTDYFRGAAILIGWAAVAGLAYFVSNVQIETKLYDPFEILGIRKARIKWYSTVNSV